MALEKKRKAFRNSLCQWAIPFFDCQRGKMSFESNLPLDNSEEIFFGKGAAQIGSLTFKKRFEGESRA